MDIVIVGAGEVGRQAAELLSGAGHNVTLVDRSAQVLAVVEDSFDVRVLRAAATEADALRQAGADTCDLLVAATDSDEINLLCASIGKALGAGKVVARVHHSAYYVGRGLDYARHFGIDQLICPEHLTALEIAGVLRNPGAIWIEHLARGKVELQRLAVDARADVIGVPLRELRLRAARVATVEREGRAFIAGADTVLRHGDIVTLIGEARAFEATCRRFQTQRPEAHHVVIMGGSAMGVWLARALQSRHFSVRLFETDRARAEELSGKLEHVTVIQADPTDPLVFADERIDSADAFVALTYDDEHNILAAVQAKSKGVARTIAVLARPTYLNLIERVGIDRAFCPRIVAGREILRIVRSGPVRLMASLAEGVAGVFEIRPHPASKALGVPLSRIRLPRDCMIAAIQRGETVTVPGGEDHIEADDTVVAIAPHEHDKKLRKLFSEG